MLAAGVATWRVWRSRGWAHAGRDGRSQPRRVHGARLLQRARFPRRPWTSCDTAAASCRRPCRATRAPWPRSSASTTREIEAACREAAQGEVVEAVNFNAPGQVVIAGHATAVQRAIEAAKARGAKRAVLLPVSVPSHSSLMKGAAEELAARLAATPFACPTSAPSTPSTSQVHESADGIRRALKEQLFRPVRWADTVRAMLASGVTTLIECGPGKVLTSLNRRIERRTDLTMLALDDPATLDAALATCREKGHA